jgi:hypothetical protein
VYVRDGDGYVPRTYVGAHPKNGQVKLEDYTGTKNGSPRTT